MEVKRDEEDDSQYATLGTFGPTVSDVGCGACVTAGHWHQGVVGRLHREHRHLH